MTPRPLMRAALAALVAAPLSVASATAEEAAATTSLNVRSGPGTSFGVVDVLDPGEVVDMTECQANGWCYVTHDGPDGWVSSAYLTAAPSAGSPGSDCRFQLTFGAEGPRFSIVCGDGGAPSPAPEPGGEAAPVGDQACFYDLPNFEGESFCRGPVTLNSLPPAADDRITSVRLSGDVRVELCVDPDLGGFCRVVRASEGRLGNTLNDRVSSLRVFVEAAAPTVVSTGSLNLPETRRLNLDNGNIGMAGADIWYRAHMPDVRRLVPINGAQFARGDGSDRGYAGCLAESYSSNPLYAGDVPVGTHVCVRTSEGRISQFRVDGVAGTDVVLSYTTFGS
ncbi:MAG: SH3 domain-containing protein [Paracoccaceae bacterium]|nr:SH3 domain-containing protein [Paracoccaceae bacterium]